jgi:hypothetical protein
MNEDLAANCLGETATFSVVVVVLATLSTLKKNN